MDEPVDVQAGGETYMMIPWRHDIDAVLNEARAEGRSVLMDFNAAPM